ncbi:MAG: ABC transporter ATP-binding protein [Ferruginibacter sp.]
MLPLLQINDLSISFSAEGNISNAVRNISFSIQPGELVAIVGESGSGKSITALSLLKLLPEQASVTGSLLFSKNGKDSIDIAALKGNAVNQIRGNDIAMIFQEPMTSLNPVLTCGSQVEEAIRLHQKISSSEAREQTIALFEKVKLPDPEGMLKRFPHQLSGGQKQRVMIAMAMSCNPALLIADEPTTALDVTVQQTILELIKSLQQQNNMGVIFITHDLAVVAEIADRIIVMYKGEIAEQGNAKEILKNPQHNYTKALLACRPAAHTKGQRLPVVSDFLIQPLTPKGEKEISNREQGIPNRESGAADSASAIVLKVEHLNVHFPVKKKLFGKVQQAFRAVDDVSFEVTNGEIVGLVGESGCGKTTLGRTILQLIQPTSGKIILNGKDIAHAAPSALRNIRKDLQIVFQDPYGSLNPRMTIGNAILEPLKVHAIAGNNSQRKEKVMDLLDKVSLNKDHFNRYPHQFSGGQRQRICIARALALNPSFLIFDESVSALDVSVQAQVLNLIMDLKTAFDFTSIFISHDLSVVRYISDRIMVMRKGKIVEEGLADQIYHHPKNEYTRQLIDAIPGKALH